MLRRTLLAVVSVLILGGCLGASEAAAQERAFGQVWGGTHGYRDWERFYHYPYVFYPQNFWGNEYYRSSESLYHRYPPEMRIPVYNKRWHNYYPDHRSFHAGQKPPHFGPRYHSGHQFILDVF